MEKSISCSTATDMEFEAGLNVPARVIVGADALEKSRGLLAGYGKKTLVVTGKHVGRSAMMSRLKAVLDRDGVEYAVFDGITGEPTDTMIADGVEAYRDSGCDFCIGLGGGSPLDSAKAIAAMTVNDGEIADYNGRIMEIKIPNVVAIPTTAGTGSEATKFTIITDTKRGIKMLLKGDVLLPVLAVADYTMGIDAPKGVTAATGLDALTHAIEAFISVKASAATDRLAADAVKRIMRYLPDAYRDGGTEAREQMACAALQAGVCINNSSVTVVHGMSRPIGALFHVPHGISNAMLLSACLNDMLAEAEAKYAELARIIGVAADGDTDAAAAEAFIAAVENLCKVCEVPTLKEYGIDEKRFVESIDKMAADAIASGSPANAPKAYTAADCRHLYLAAFPVKA